MLLKKENKNSKERHFGLQNINNKGKKEVNSGTGSCSKVMLFQPCTQSPWALQSVDEIVVWLCVQACINNKEDKSTGILEILGMKFPVSQSQAG